MCINTSLDIGMLLAHAHVHKHANYAVKTPRMHWLEAEYACVPCVNVCTRNCDANMRNTLFVNALHILLPKFILIYFISLFFLIQFRVHNFAIDVPILLAANVRVLVYSGMLDFICNYYGGRAWVCAYVRETKHHLIGL